MNLGNLLLTAEQSGGGMSSLLLLGGMLVVLYLIMFLPQRKQQKRDAEMRSSLDVGDEVITQGGIVGTIVSLKDEMITIETGADRVKLRILRNAVLQNRTAMERARDEAVAKAEAKEAAKKEKNKDKSK